MTSLRTFAVCGLILAGTIRTGFAQADFAEPTSTEPDTQQVSTTAGTLGLTSQTEPLTLSERYKWAARSSVSPARLAGYAISSAWSTMTNKPEEYGPHWDGFGRRFGSRVANGATGIMMEASIGALWNEDPRYVRAAGQPIKSRLFHVAKMTVLARNRNGELRPAYARYLSVPANSFMSNAWRPDSEANVSHATVRIEMAFLNRAVGNLFAEFWPDATKWLHRK